MINLIFTLLIFVFSVFTTSLMGQDFSVTDIGLTTAYQDTSFGHHKRGRANIAADFDLDGVMDFYMGNPSDESFILRGSYNGQNELRFEMHQLLLTGDLTWGAVSFDYDNDGDYDLFISCGGNEGIGLDYLFRNDWIKDGLPTGELVFTDVTEEAGVAGIVPEGEDQAIQSASANAVTADYDRDGDVDLFVNGNEKNIPNYPELMGRNILYQNNGDGTFTDVSIESGLAANLGKTRHSTFFDYNNDGLVDLYEHNFKGENILWENMGDGTFQDVTDARSAPGHDLGYPIQSFASASADFNNDGWEDLLVVMRLTGETGPYPDGHLIFMNNQGESFENVADQTILNDDYTEEYGVMGCQLGDLNGDGIADIYLGNGAPPSGQNDQLYFSIPNPDGTFNFEDVSSFIDFPAEIPVGIDEPDYPYRTHGTAFVDADGDGTLEIAVSNGGPSVEPDSIREPNRLFKFNFDEPYNWLKIRPVGDGNTISKDAIGTRIAVQVSKGGLETRTLYKTLFAGSAFSAQNGFDVHFGLGDSDVIESITLTWPDGSVSQLTENLEINSSMVVTLEANGTTVNDVIVPNSPALAQNYPNPFNPSTTISYQLPERSDVSLNIFNSRGQLVRSLISNDAHAAGEFDVIWNGTDNSGKLVSSGVYFYSLTVDAKKSSKLTRKMLLMK